MTLIADILLVAGALGASVYCYVLAQRLKRFNDLENGVGGAVAVMSAQVDDMTKTLNAARETTGKSNDALEALTTRAEDAAKRLELMLASLHDLPVGPNSERSAQVEREDPIPEKSAPLGPMFVRHAHADVESSAHD